MTTGYDGQRRGSGCSFRLIAAVAILLFGAMSYYFSTQKNPITGETQRVKLTPQQEVALGLQAAPEMAAQMGGVVDPRRPEAQLVATVGQKLVTQLQGELKADMPYKFNFHLLADSRTVNAFALPGGQIFITYALFSQLQNEAQLAGVLGHEIGHVIHRHAAEHMASADFYQSIVTATGVGTGDMRAAQVAQYVTGLRQLKYGRADELESDEWGLLLMTKSGYDPREMLGVMEVLKRASSRAGGSEMLATHPHPDSRIARIEEWLNQNKNALGPNLTKGQPLARD